MRSRVIAVFGASFIAAQVSGADPPVLTSQQDKVSYSIGVSLGRSVTQQKVDVDREFLLLGVRDALSGADLLLSEVEVGRIVATVQTELRRKQAEARRAGGEENKKKGEAFLAENGTRDGVVTLPSGLQYKVLKEGAGRKPGDNDMVEARYRGTLIDGTEFDGSDAKGGPGVFRVNGVIGGWNEALKLMPVGSRWQLFVPPALAYGGRGAGGMIGPYATLVFELELVAIR